jgi:hypothetical protein
MNIAVIADIHGQLEALAAARPYLEAADLILLSGDLTHFGREQQAARVLDSFKPFRASLYAVTGNCDYPEVGQLLVERGMNLDGCWVEARGLNLVGLGGSLPAPGSTPNEYSEAELELRLTEAVKDQDLSRPFLFVCHQPPLNTMADRLQPGQHVGSQSVRRFIEANQPLACLSGHIHEGVGVDQIGPSQIVNPGPFMDGCLATLDYTEGDLTVQLHKLGG